MKYSTIKAEKDVPIAEDLQGKKLPVLIFSHGVRGHKNSNSGFC